MKKSTMNARCKKFVESYSRYAARAYENDDLNDAACVCSDDLSLLIEEIQSEWRIDGHVTMEYLVDWCLEGEGLRDFFSLIAGSKKPNRKAMGTGLRMFLKATKAFYVARFTSKELGGGKVEIVLPNTVSLARTI